MAESMDYRAEIRALLRERIGLDECSIGAATLDRGIQRAMKAAGCASDRDYCEHLNRKPAAMRGLIEEVVVPETWFFRDPSAFSALQSVLAPEWLCSRQERPVRVLSIPCATGEEPYSIAICLLEALRDSVRFTVDAADISERALAKAVRAEYGVQAFRGRNAAARHKYLEKSGGAYRVIAPVRERVSFRTANLLAPDLKTLGPYDCIFCRNVLIYLDRSLKDVVTAHLDRMLAPDGVLFVAAAEAAWLADGPFERLRDVPAAFRKRRAEGAVAAQIARPASIPQSRSRKDGSKFQLAFQLAAAGAVSRPTRVEAPPNHALDRARAEADAGRLREAATYCRLYLEHHGTSVDGHYLLGLLHDAMNECAEAIACYRRTLYLDPLHQRALEHLALLHEKRGELQASRQWKTRLERLIRSAS